MDTTAANGSGSVLVVPESPATVLAAATSAAPLLAAAGGGLMGELPPELVQTVAVHVPIRTVGAMMLVQQVWHQALRAEAFWHLRVRRDFSWDDNAQEGYPQSEEESTSTSTSSWRDYYQSHSYHEPAFGKWLGTPYDRSVCRDPAGIAINTQPMRDHGHILLVQNGTVTVISPLSGQVVRTIGDDYCKYVRTPNGVAIAGGSGGGEQYVAVTVSWDYCVLLFALRTGQLVQKIGEGELSYRSGICVDSGRTGNIIATDANKCRLLVFSPEDGRLLNTFTTPEESRPCDVRVTPHGEVITTDSKNKKLLIFSLSTGQLVRRIGRFRELQDPQGLEIDGDNIIVADNKKLVLFEGPTGRLVRRIGLEHEPGFMAITPGRRLLISHPNAHCVHCLNLNDTAA